MAKFAIFANGTWQGNFDGATKTEALSRLDDMVGVNPHGVSLDELCSEFQFFEVTEEQAAAVEEWFFNGAPSAEFPLDA